MVLGALWLGWLILGPRAQPPASPLVAAGFAEDFVATFLAAGEGREESLVPFLGYPPSLEGMAAGSFYTVRATARDIRQTDGGWLVLIRAELLTRTDGGYGPAEPHSFSVAMREVPGEGLRAVALPTPAPLPPPTAAGPPAATALPEDKGLVTAVRHLLDWYLTDSAPIAGLAPSGGFAATELVHLEVDDEQATAGVLATTAGGHKMRLDVPLFRSAGSWRVVELSPGSS